MPAGIAMSGAGIGDGGERRPTGGAVGSAREGGRSWLGHCGAARGGGRGWCWAVGLARAELVRPGWPFSIFFVPFSFSIFCFQKYK